MRILVVATKSPWPPVDGGRLALWLTLQELARAGHAIALVAPVDPGDAHDDARMRALRSVCTPHLVPVAARGWPAAVADAVRRGNSSTVARHRRVELQHAVARCLSTWQPDVVHAEQLQAMANCAPAIAAGMPVLLRMQNVESAIWERIAGTRRRLRPLRWEAVRLARDERRAIAAASRVVAMTAADAAALRTLAEPSLHARITAIPPPFPRLLPAGAQVEGAPAIALAGSTGWRPNQDGLDWFVDGAASRLHAAQPAACLHVYGGRVASRPGVQLHPAPADAAVAFPAGAIAAIPLRAGSGIRMRMLEAWARGLPVVATTIAASGLHVQDGRELLIADTPEAFVRAITRLAVDPVLRAALTAAGRDYLQRHHDGDATTAALAAQYVAAVERDDGASRSANPSTAAGRL